MLAVWTRGAVARIRARRPEWWRTARVAARVQGREMTPTATATVAPAPPAGRVFARRATSLAPRIVVLGGGFAGVTAALELAKRCAGTLPVDITLISDR